MRKLSGNAKMSRENVLTMRRRYADGATQRELCQVYGLSITAVGRIVRRETWGWLTEEGGGIEPLGIYDAPLPPTTPEIEEAAKASQARLLELLAKGGVKEE